MKKEFGGPLIGLELFKCWVTGYSLQDELNVTNNSKEEDDDKVLATFIENLDRLSLELPEDRIHKLLDFHRNHRNRRKIWSVSETFPDQKISEEYLKPKANYSETRFTWSIPDLEQVKNYFMGKIGWSLADVQSKIVPVIQVLSNNAAIQTRIESYFHKYDDGMKFAKVKSKRLLSALQKSALPQIVPLCMNTENDEY